MQFKLWHVPLRLATGAFILNSGLSKRSARGEAAEGLHDFATAGHPELEAVEPETFVKGLSVWEMALSSALLVPLVPSWLAGAGLTAFS